MLLRTLIVLVVIALMAAWFVLPKLIVSPYRFDASQHISQFPKGITPEDYGLAKDDFDITTTDGYNLDAWFIHAKDDSAKCTLILLHGVGACKELFLTTAKLLSDHHCNVVLFDLRAQGRSGGPHCTYGYLEKDDVKIFTDQLLAQDSELPVGLYGCSLGGAMAYQSLANDQRLAFGVIESTFDELKNVVRIYTEHHFGFTCHPLSDFALWRAEHMADFDADSVKPVESARRITQPVFVAHGDRDENIPFESGKRNFDALASPDKVFYPIPGAGHNNLGAIGGEVYTQAKRHFINDCCSRK